MGEQMSGEQLSVNLLDRLYTYMILLRTHANAHAFICYLRKIFDYICLSLLKLYISISV